MLRLAILLIGFVILVGVLAYFGTLVGMPPQLITFAVLLLIAVGVAMAARRRHHRDPHDPP